jgi:hypothetical protein
MGKETEAYKSVGEDGGASRARVKGRLPSRRLQSVETKNPQKQRPNKTRESTS